MLKRKLAVTLIACALMVTSAGAGAFAATNLQAIKANLNLGLKFKVNGKNWTPKDQNGQQIYPITYKGTTYLPVRSAGDALGIEVGWEEANQTVWLGEGAKAVEEGRKPESAPKYSRSNPAPINTKATLEYQDVFDEYTAEITVNEVIRGAEANSIIANASSTNQTASKGYEYLLVKVTFKLLSLGNEEAKHDLSPVHFSLISASGKAYDYSSIIVPEPAIRTSLYQGASHTGWIAYQVSTDDKPLLAYGRNYDGTGGVWFKLQ